MPPRAEAAQSTPSPAPATAARASAGASAASPRPGEGPVFFAAGFWRRAAAGAIDMAFVVPVAAATAYLAGALAELRLPERSGTEFWLDLALSFDPAVAGALGIALAVFALYILVFVGAAAQTPGLRAVGARVIDVYGDPPSPARALARIGGFLASLATLGLGLIWAAFDREKRGLPDWVAGTFVVKESKAGHG